MTHVFHCSFPVRDLESTRAFYGGLLGCKAGRTEADRIDFEFFGHHIVAQVSVEEAAHRSVGVGPEPYPLRHFGVLVSRPEFERIAERLTAAGTPFVIPPETRHAGTVREQMTMFALDPSGNGVEFKCLADPANVFKA
jgi:extradiol dioxygenase family protein